mgnify:CR=1 FL=1|jgi:hypothetical protein
MICVEFWMVKDLPAGPRKHKVSASLCTIPQGYKAGFGGRQAEAVTLTAKHTQGNPNWITFCAGVWSQLKFLTRVWYQPANKAAVVKNGDFLYDMIHNTPERLLAHEFTHGEGQFGDYYGSKYSMMLLSAYRSANEWLSSKCFRGYKVWLGSNRSAC